MPAMMLLASCDKESYRHSISLGYPTPGAYGCVYADQPQDSVVFYTFDSYRATTNASWVSIASGMEAITIENSYWYMVAVSIPLLFEPNTDGRTRECAISIYNYGADNWATTITASFLQLGWLNITNASVTYEEYSSTSYPLTATFELSDSALQVTDSLAFTVYGDWEIEYEPGFINIEQTSGSAGHNVVPIVVAANEETGERSADITLRSSGVETTVKLTQSGKKEKGTEE